MRPLIEEIATELTPEQLTEQLAGEPGVVLLRSGLFDSTQGRYSFVAAWPFLTFRSLGSVCELSLFEGTEVQFGNPWHLLEAFMSRYELLEEVDLPFPLGGCFGYWGYDLKNFVEPKLPRRAINDLELPECLVGFYDSLTVFDHCLGKTWVVSTGLQADGSRSDRLARDRSKLWRGVLRSKGSSWTALEDSVRSRRASPSSSSGESHSDLKRATAGPTSNLSAAEFITCVERVQAYIKAGDIYQVNLSHRLSAPLCGSGWDLFQGLSAVSPSPFSAYLDCGEFQIVSSSPELFLRMSGTHIQTRPIKGTRPRSPDPTRDAQLSYELQTSAKEMAELVMITDLLRNDLGRVCEFSSVLVPELMRLERYSQVQHLVSTVEGRLRAEVTHFAAFASCFPGGSISGAPKFRAMEIIDELEPSSRGPYTGALGYLGFNRESQLSIIIRAAIVKAGAAYFHAGAGIVADSLPQAEYEETLSKAQGFFRALERNFVRA